MTSDVTYWLLTADGTVQKDTRPIALLGLLRKSKGFTQQTLAFHSGISRKHISQIEQGKADPTIGVLVRLAAALEVEVQDLLEQELPKGSVRAKGLKSQYRLPIFREVVPGDPGKTRQKRIDELAVQPNQYGKSRYILKVRGDSIKPAIHSADLMLIDNGARARHSDIIACTINGESTLRRYERKCKCRTQHEDERKCKSVVIVLKADNPSYDPIVVTRADTFAIHGVVLELLRRKFR